MEELTRVTTYQQYKQAMDTELRRTTEGFVRIGYLLKMARDTDILRESGYSSVVEFAQKEYNIDKTQVSRFIHINDRFSEGGYSDRLLEQYQDFGYAKLTIMLQLPDELNEVLTPDYSKAEIQTLKEEYDAEQKITDLEVMMEGQEPTQATMDSTIAKALHQLFKDNPEKYVEVHKNIGGGLAAVMEVLAPSGAMIYNVRLQGIGRIAISLHEDYDTLDLVNLRDGELEKVPWTEVMETLQSMINTLQEPEYNWEQIYGEAFPAKQPEKPEVAPVQQEKPAEKPAPRKERKVVKAKEPKPEPKPEPEEQLPGQMDITEFKEALPEPAEAETEPEVIAEEDIEVVEEPETSIPTLAEEISEEEVKKEIVRHKAAITSALRNAPRHMVAGEWDELGRIAMDIKFRADKIKELEGK